MSPREQSASAFTGVALMKASNHRTLCALTTLPAHLRVNVFLSSLNHYLRPRKERKQPRRFGETANGADDKFCKGSQQLDLKGAFSAPAAQLNTLAHDLAGHGRDNGALFYHILQHRQLFHLLPR